MSSISIKQLLEAGVHFGHQTSRWNPKMKEFIFGERNGIHIIDLQKTMVLFKDAVDFLSDLAAQGKEVLFVGTKRQAHEAIEEDAIRCEMHFVTNRWLGGLLTNFETVRNSIKRYKELEGMREDGFYSKLTSKKEIAQLERERKRLDKNLRGIREMDRLPDALFVIDSDNEAIAVKEANRLGIPVVAIVDTNCDPDEVDYIVPGNDDALRSVKLFTSTIADALAAGRSVWQARIEEQRRAREQAEKEEAARAAAAKAAAEARRAEREKARAAEAEAEAAAAAAKAAKPPESEGEAAKEGVTPEAEAPAEGKAGAREPAAGPTAEEAEAAAEAAAGEPEAETAVAEKPAGRKDKSEPVKTEKSERESTEEKKSKPTKPKGPRKKAAAKSKTDKAEEPPKAASAKEESTEESKEAGSSKKKTSAKNSEDSEEVAADN